MTTNHCPRSIPARIVYRTPRYSIGLSFSEKLGSTQSSAAKLLSKDEARRIAANVAKLTRCYMRRRAIRNHRVVCLVSNHRSDGCDH